jgi:hypothetical protein
MDPLTTSLLDLVYELEGRDVSITVGGGFGLYLKRQHLARTGQRTLFDELPVPRSTNDLDLFLQAEMLASFERTRQVAEVICRLGYTVVEAAKFLQWKRAITVAGVPQEVKIDFLVGPLGDFREKLYTKKLPRVRPKQSIEFHAHTVEEAIHLEDEPIAVIVDGKRSTGVPYSATLYIPQAFPYLMMKLHAFDDRRDDADKDLGRHHALDLYTIVGMMAEKEYERAKELGAAYATDEHVRRACAIVRAHFPSRATGPPVASDPWTQHSIEQGHYSDTTALGILRLQEHQLFRNEFLLEEFTSVLAEIFCVGR